MAPRKNAGEKAVAQSEEQVQAAVDEETEQGFRGTKVDPLPNEAYSLESGPDSPTPAEQRAALAEAEAEAAAA